MNLKDGTIGVSELRLLSAEELRQLEKSIVVQYRGSNLAVVVPYALYLQTLQWLAEGAKAKDYIKALKSHSRSAWKEPA